MAALITNRWATANAMIWLCDTTADMKKSPCRAVLRKDPNTPPHHEYVSPSSTERPNMVLKEAVGTSVGGRGLRPAEAKHFSSTELEATPADYKCQSRLVPLLRPDLQ